jgi:hypothetical protein
VSSAVLLLALSGAARADRPTDGTGLFAFDASDELDFVDGPAGIVRVHFSVSGPNETRMADDDGDGEPDFPAMVAETAEDVLAFYEDFGFRPPVRESELGLAPLGGTDAFDFYLVDFGGNADGNFALDACAGSVCAGHMIMENDFAGYGYPSLSVATEILTSHELFHAVQAAYNAGQPSWMSEGTAVWAEWLYAPGNRDFIYFSEAYLEDPGRSIDRPPAGVATAFTYGTALFFGFLDEYVDASAAIDLQEEMEGRSEDEAVAAMAAVVEAWGGTLPDAWTVFVEWNLATGDRAGGADSYSFAEQIDGPVLEDESTGLLQDDNRFYPLAATYYQLTHDGGPMAFATPDDPAGLRFALFPVADGGDDGAVDAPVARWQPLEPGLTELGELPEGGYLLVGTYPEPASQSQKIEFCLGFAEEAAACLPEDEAEPEDDTGGGDTTAPKSGEEEGGCSTAAGGASAILATLPALLSLGRRRRRASAGTPPAC